MLWFTLVILTSSTCGLPIMAALNTTPANLSLPIKTGLTDVRRVSPPQFTGPTQVLFGHHADKHSGVDSFAHVPIDADAKAADDVYNEDICPVEAMACNVDIKDIEAGDGIELGSKFARHISLVSIIQSMEADLSKITDMVMNYDKAAPDSLDNALRNLQEVQVRLESMADQATDHIASLMNGMLQGLAQTDSMVAVLKQGVIDDLPNVFQSVFSIRQEFPQIFGAQAPELLSVMKSLEDSMCQLLSTVISLVPDSANTLAALLTATHAPTDF